MNNRSKTTGNHYAALDALRGIAAISVLFYHFHEWLGQKWLAPNARFAVDFFFCLSGYVLSAAYVHRMGCDLKKFDLIRTRLIRLMPIIFLGTAISALYYAVRILVLKYPLDPGLLSFATLLGLLNLPFFDAPKIIGGPQVFPLNGPQYTLFLELVVNLFWIMTHRYSAIKTNIAIILISVVLMFCCGIGGDTAETFWMGFPRVFGAYYLGVIAFELDSQFHQLSLRQIKALFAASCITTLSIFYWPTSLPNGVGIIWGFALSPVIIVCGARLNLSGSIRWASNFLGQISYPVYALQFPVFLWMNGVYQQLLGCRDSGALMVIVTIALLCISWVVLRYYDVPVRRFLMRLNKNGRLEPAGVEQRML